ncbi:hypothetical protein EMIT0P100_90171 [Pseudomonas sp. IT-P100]
MARALDKEKLTEYSSPVMNLWERSPPPQGSAVFEEFKVQKSRARITPEHGFFLLRLTC